MAKPTKSNQFVKAGNYKEMVRKLEARKTVLTDMNERLSKKVIDHATMIGELKSSEFDKVIKLRNDLATATNERNIFEVRNDRLERLWFVRLFRL